MADEIQVQSEPNGMYAVAGYIDDATGETRKVTDAVPLPVTAAGGATEATLQQVGSAVDGLEALLTTIDGRVDGVEASLTTLAGHVDTLETLLAPPGTIGNGATKTVAAAATPEQLTGSSTPCRAVYLRAPASNTGVVGWGGSGIAGSGGNGPQLGPGDEVWIPIDNANKIYLSSSVNGEGVKWSYVA